MSASVGVISIPAWAWEQATARQALRRRDIGSVFAYVQQYSGASQARIAAAVNMTQSRVNEIINRRREVSRLDVYERIADGLDMPDDARHLLGLAASREKRSGGAAFDLSAFPEVVRVYASQASAREEIQQQARSMRRARRSRGARPRADRFERLAPAGLSAARAGRPGAPDARAAPRSRVTGPRSARGRNR